MLRSLVGSEMCIRDRDMSAGRFMVPWSPQDPVSPITIGDPLASGEDRIHAHRAEATITLRATDYVGAHGGGNGDTAHDLTGSVQSQIESADVSLGLPYIQLLTCKSGAPTFNSSGLPSGALLFTTTACPPGWGAAISVNGRFLVANPNGGQAGSTFGGNSIDPTSTFSHSHDFSGSFDTTAAGVGLAHGCCAHGYVANGTYEYSNTTDPGDPRVPALLTYVCQLQTEIDAARESSLAAHDRNTAPPRLPNIDFVGRSYNIVKGNPHANEVDPGWRLGTPVLKLSYSQNSTSADGRWSVPDNIDALPGLNGCNYQGQSMAVHDAKTYQHSLNVDVTVKAGIPLFAFSASTDYQKVQESTSVQDRTFTSTNAWCSAYSAGTMPNIPVELTDSFRRGVELLPTTYDSSALNQFIVEYGTHYVSSILMGGKTIRSCSLDREQYTNLTQNGVNVATGASCEFGVFHGSVEAKTGVHSKDYEAFSQYSNSCSEKCLGKCAPTTNSTAPDPWQDAAEWQAVVMDDPYPLQYDLNPLEELISPAYFPSMSVSDLFARRSNLAMYLQDDYCKSFGGDCTSPADSGYWMTYPTSPILRASHTAVSVGTKMMVFGGSDDNFQVLASAQSYDSITNQWADLAPLPTARSDTVSGVLEESVIVAGGMITKGGQMVTVDVVEQYFPKQNQWTSLPHMLYPRQNAAAVVYNGTMIVSGGCQMIPSMGGCGGVDTVEVFDPKIWGWVLLKPLAAARWGHGIVLYGSSMLVMGGLVNQTTSTSFEQYDIKTMVAKELSPMPSVRTRFAVELMGDVGSASVVVMGGVDSRFMPLDIVELYNVTSDTWHTRKAMAVGRSTFSSSVLVDVNDNAQGVPMIYTVGGNSGNASAVSILEVLNPEV
eukprot:TRINITY_DN1347_c0_g1_i10.p1 TRINITY_DN1347_c0_g1~~TRINITY_DN1347_c0_g1_i10.p1  ORF type:complete len:884 (-),score=62.20 TRINITY_DN1347_c0_g1_i10:115-2766(-)